MILLKIGCYDKITCSKTIPAATIYTSYNKIHKFTLETRKNGNLRDFYYYN